MVAREEIIGCIGLAVSLLLFASCWNGRMADVQLLEDEVFLSMN